ncbi:MAG TPA: fibro-slime domain-containing protein [Phycisphaerales bacterium]|nr:fibro-slime domain-containing protein [Phycisphaerales bacterium]HRQ76305.1 fibro-slime domain-containing protein [Phycisphaerales bacterium]
MTSRINLRNQGTQAALLTPVALGLAFSLPAVADPPSELHLTGIVRDFRERTVPGGHPDFERQPAKGFGLYAGLVHHVLDADGKPTFSGEGYKVLAQPRDAMNRPLAWHFYNSYWVCHSGYPDQDCVTLKDSGAKLNFKICFVSAVFNPDGTSTWTYHVSELGVPGGKDLSHWNLKLDPSHQVVDWSPKSGNNHVTGVSVGTDGSTGFYGIKWDVTDAFSSGTFTVTLDKQYFGGTNVAGVLAKGGNKSDKADFFSPTTTLSDNSTPFSPTYSLTYDQNLGDTIGTVGPLDVGGITSAESFSQWFRDVPGVNMSKPITIKLVRQENGSYVFDDRDDENYSGLNGFFPIENALFGQSGGSPNRNFHFTFEIHADFTYDANGNQFFHFIGDDDVWVFIDGKLVIDIGGVHAAVEQYVDLSRLCLDHGKTYRLSFFFAERHRTQSNCRIVTNLELETRGVPAITAMFD